MLRQGIIVSGWCRDVFPVGTQCDAERPGLLTAVIDFRSATEIKPCFFSALFLEDHDLSINDRFNFLGKVIPVRCMKNLAVQIDIDGLNIKSVPFTDPVVCLYPRIEPSVFEYFRPYPDVLIVKYYITGIGSDQSILSK